MTEPFLLCPLDTFWTRDGRPFSAGEASAAAALFPPTPWTWQGMVRTRLLTGELKERLASASTAAVQALVGPPDALPAGWRLWGPLPAAPAQGAGEPRIEPWAPWPAFLSPRADGEHARPWRDRARPREQWEGLRSSAQAGAAAELEPLDPRGKPAEGGWISASNLRWALLGLGDWDPTGAHAPGPKRAQGEADLPPFVAAERRPGLAIEADGRAMDHMLYFAEHLRFADGAGLWGRLDGANAGLSSHLRAGRAALGRQGREGTLSTPAEPTGWSALLAGEHLGPQAEGGAHLRVVLLSPAARSGDRDAWPFPLPAGARLRGAALRRGPPIGGFDVRGAGASRDSASTFGAGSSFWVDLSQLPTPGERAAAARAVLGLAPDTLTELERFGFGQRVGAFFQPVSGDPAPMEG
jgi:hypothetical protein